MDERALGVRRRVMSGDGGLGALVESASSLQTAVVD